MAQNEQTLEVNRDGSVASIIFSKSHPQNPFSTERQIELTARLREQGDDPNVNVVVLYGGEGRSFSAGGDFKEVVTFVGKEEVDRWLKATLDLYVTVLGLSKPVIAAIDGYAIGFGLQVALTCDYRIGSHRCGLSMPELKKGIGCINGTYMLEKVIGRANMQELVWECSTWSAETARSRGLLHKVVDSARLMEETLAFAGRVSEYGRAAVARSKASSNRSFIAELTALYADAVSGHRETFSDGTAQQHLKQFLAK